MKEKRGIEMEMLAWWVIGVVILIIAIGGIMILQSKGIDALEYLQNLFRFGA